MKKMWVILIIVAVIVGGAAFFGGMKYSSAKAGSQVGAQRAGQFGAGGVGGTRGAGRAGAGAGGGFVNGQILSKDAQSITLSVNGGGSKIVFFSGTTEISKFVAGTADDLVVGQNVMVNGTANADGSVVAKTIQSRPAMPNAPTAPGQQGTVPTPATK